MDARKCRTCGERHWGPICPSPKSSRGGVESRPRKGKAEAAVGPREAKPKVGRPLDSEKGKTLTATQPWVAAGMSRRTWYRRQAEKSPR